MTKPETSTAPVLAGLDMFGIVAVAMNINPWFRDSNTHFFTPKTEFQYYFQDGQRFFTPTKPILKCSDPLLSNDDHIKKIRPKWKKLLKAVNVIESPAVGFREGRNLDLPLLEMIGVGDFLARNLINPEIWLPANMSLYPGLCYTLTDTINEKIPLRVTVWQPTTLNELFEADLKLDPDLSYQNWLLRYGLSIQPPRSPHVIKHDYIIGTKISLPD